MAHSRRNGGFPIGVSNAEINRELAALKRAFSLAVKDGKLMVKPYIPMLKENNVRKVSSSLSSDLTVFYGGSVHPIHSPYHKYP